MHTKYIYVHQEKKRPNDLKTRDNICNTLANFRFLIKTKIL